MTSPFQDLRPTLRTLVARPLFIWPLILVLSLGIGGATTMFTVIDGIFLEPLPFPHADRLVFLPDVSLPSGAGGAASVGEGSAFAALAHYWSGGANIRTDALTERISAAVVTGGFFRVFETPPLMGRTIIDDDIARRVQVVIISGRLWRRIWDEDPRILGKNIELNAMPYTVVGVMPDSFGFPGHTDVWLPQLWPGGPYFDLGSDTQTDLPLGFGVNTTVGRINEGVTVAQSIAELNVTNQKPGQAEYGTQKARAETVVGLAMREVMVQEFRPALFMLFAAVGLVLLVACVNAANMIVARAITRKKELAVRAALGASPWRIARQLLAESLMIALFASISGTLIAVGSVTLIRLFGPRNVPRLLEIRVNPRVLLFSVALAVLVGLLVGIAPIAQVLRSDLTGALKKGTHLSGSGQPLGRSVRGALVVLEVALTFVLLVASGATIESFRKLLRVEPGFDQRNLLTLEIALPAAKYEPPDANSLTAGKAAPHVDSSSGFYENLEQQALQIPGVSAVGAVDRLPLGGKSGIHYHFASGSPKGGARGFAISGDYFRAMGIPVLAGRSFGPQDGRTAAKVAVVSRRLTALLWGSQSVIGNSIALAGEDGARQIVGVVGDVKYLGLGATPGPDIYVPQSQPYGRKSPDPAMTLVVRTSVDPHSVIAPLRNRILRLEGTAAPFQIRTMEEVIGDSTADVHFHETILSLFADLSFVLALIGVYGVVAFSVSSRTHEIGVRMSLGASQRSLLQMVCGEGMRLCLYGIGIGLVLAYGFHRVVASLIAGADVPTPLVPIVSGTLLLAGTLGAGVIPAIRAARISPSTALRYD
jgi:putative ABC transport system permease protein